MYTAVYVYFLVFSIASWFHGKLLTVYSTPIPVTSNFQRKYNHLYSEYTQLSRRIYACNDDLTMEKEKIRKLLAENRNNRSKTLAEFVQENENMFEEEDYLTNMTTDQYLARSLQWGQETRSAGPTPETGEICSTVYEYKDPQWVEHLTGVRVKLYRTRDHVQRFQTGRCRHEGYVVQVKEESSAMCMTESHQHQAFFFVRRADRDARASDFPNCNVHSGSLYYCKGWVKLSGHCTLRIIN